MKSTATYEKLTISPSMARSILEAQPEGNNRKLNKWAVQRLERKILDGKWNEDVGKVIVTRGGRLIDGQHRLHAIANTGVGVCLVVCTVETEAEGMEIMKQLDTGARRTTTQTLKIMGHNYKGVDIASANFLAFLEEMAFPEGEPRVITSHMETLDPDDTIDYLNEYGQQLTAMRPVTVTHNAACVYGTLSFAARKYPIQANVAMEFIRELQVNGNPILKEFKAPVTGLLKKDLGGAVPRATTALMILELVKSLVTGKAQYRAKLIDTEAKTQNELVRFFYKAKPGDGQGGMTIKKKAA